VRPDVVLYEEALPEDVWKGAVKALAKADLLIVGGTSLAVYPAAHLVAGFNGKRLVLINREETPYDNKADLVLSQPIGQVLAAVVD
jgi:NAD-dependent deacetylase